MARSRGIRSVVLAGPLIGALVTACGSSGARQPDAWDWFPNYDGGSGGWVDARTLDDPPLTIGVSIAAGWEHTCAVLEDGLVRCWGDGKYGQLGYGTTTDVGDNEPPASFGTVEVGGVVTQLALGGQHTCALLQGGAVRCWGAAHVGELGYGNCVPADGLDPSCDVGDDESPAVAGDVDVGGVATQLVAGQAFTCALLEGGHVRCWGDAGLGTLGYGNTENIGDDESPAAAGDVDIGGVVIQIAAGAWHTCALLEGGAVRCWGLNNVGQLGYGNEENIGDDESPASAGDVDVGGTVIEIAAGLKHTCALLSGGTVRCWGENADGGALGYGNRETIGDDELPASAGDVDVGGAVSHIAVGGWHTCALLDGGTVRCWGKNYYGELGHGDRENIGDDEVPAGAGDVDVGGVVTQIALGSEHSCALLQGGTVRCWGRGGYGALGYGSPRNIGDEPGEMPPADI